MGYLGADFGVVAMELRKEGVFFFFLDIPYLRLLNLIEIAAGPGEGLQRDPASLYL